MVYAPDPDIADIKARADILEVLESLGGRVDTRGSSSWDEETPIFCPFCEDLQSSKPAGRANALKGLYFCFSCGTGGDVIKLIQISKNLGFLEAIQWLEEKFPKTTENPWKT